MKKLKALVAENSSQQKEEKLVAFIFGSNTAVEMLISIVKQSNSKQPIFAYSPRFTEAQKSALEANSIKFSTSEVFTKLNLAAFKLIVTMGFLPHPAHRPVIEICALYKKMGGKTVDLQHGMFQWGLNFRDTSIEQGFDQDGSAGISLAIDTFADKKISWFGKNSVGYPKSKANNNQLKDENYVLLVTNSNWHIYSHEERIKLAYTLGKFIRENPSQRFIWKPHPAEFNQDLSPIVTIVSDYRLDNLIVIPHGQEGKSVNDLIERCSWGIATVGTCLLDFYTHNKACLIYKTNSCQALIEEFHDTSCFTNIKELRNSPTVPTPKNYREFDEKKFWTLLKPYYANLNYQKSLEHMPEIFRS